MTAIGVNYSFIKAYLFNAGFSMLFNPYASCSKVNPFGEKFKAFVPCELGWLVETLAIKVFGMFACAVNFCAF